MTSGHRLWRAAALALSIACGAIFAASLIPWINGWLDDEAAWLVGSLLAAHALLLVMTEPTWGGRVRSALLAATRSLLALILAVLVPAAAFVISWWLVPSWKGAALDTGFSCLNGANWAWTPFVLWACAAMIVRHVARRERAGTWVTAGLLAGAIASGVMAAGVNLATSTWIPKGQLHWSWLLVLGLPTATFVAYVIAAHHAWRVRPLDRESTRALVATALLLLAVQVVAAHRIHAGLRDVEPGTDAG